MPIIKSLKENNKNKSDKNEEICYIITPIKPIKGLMRSS